MGKKWLVAAAAFVVLSATLVYIMRFTPLVPDQIARAFTENLLHERGYRLQIATVRGNPLGDLRLTDVRLMGPGAAPASVKWRACARSRYASIRSICCVGESRFAPSN